jgi:hypothetical protein
MEHEMCEDQAMPPRSKKPTREAVWAVIEKRMDTIGPTRTAVMTGAGTVSKQTWYSFRDGKETLASKLGEMSLSLGWTRESIQRLIDGEEPIENTTDGKARTALDELRERAPEVWSTFERSAKSILKTLR